MVAVVQQKLVQKDEPCTNVLGICEPSASPTTRSGPAFGKKDFLARASRGVSIGGFTSVYVTFTARAAAFAVPSESTNNNAHRVLTEMHPPRACSRDGAAVRARARKLLPFVGQQNLATQAKTEFLSLFTTCVASLYAPATITPMAWPAYSTCPLHRISSGAANPSTLGVKLLVPGMSDAWMNLCTPGIFYKRHPCCKSKDYQTLCVAYDPKNIFDFANQLAWTYQGFGGVDTRNSGASNCGQNERSEELPILLRYVRHEHSLSRSLRNRNQGAVRFHTPKLGIVPRY